MNMAQTRQRSVLFFFLGRTQIKHDQTMMTQRLGLDPINGHRHFCFLFFNFKIEIKISKKEGRRQNEPLPSRVYSPSHFFFPLCVTLSLSHLLSSFDLKPAFIHQRRHHTIQPHQRCNSNLNQTTSSSSQLTTSSLTTSHGCYKPRHRRTKTKFNFYFLPLFMFVSFIFIVGFLSSLIFFPFFCAIGPLGFYLSELGLLINFHNKGFKTSDVFYL